MHGMSDPIENLEASYPLEEAAVSGYSKTFQASIFEGRETTPVTSIVLNRASPKNLPSLLSSATHSSHKHLEI